jgi:hypothetical protein
MKDKTHSKSSQNVFHKADEGQNPHEKQPDVAMDDQFCSSCGKSLSK